jgi:cell division protein FtsI/penicillin-binding protein 2
MKASLFATLVLVGLLQSANYAAPQAKSSKAPSITRGAKKAPVKKRVVRRREPVVDPTEGDYVDGDDLTIRRAAVDALGGINGSVVVVDPSNGRVFTVVNQKLAFAGGFIPCSTIKLVTSIAALREGLVERDTFIRTTRYSTFNMDSALAHSDNRYFSILGNRLGFERVNHYAQMLGLGEKAGLDIPGEQPGAIPKEPPKWGGVGLMTSFGEGFLVTPLELAALASAIANGGTLFYMQYPRTAAELEQFTPKIKRQLELDRNDLADLKIGMRGTVDYGTGRRAQYDPAEPILGKTGTCTDFRAPHKMGWFVSFNDVGRHQLVVVVMLAGGTKAANGAAAAGVAGAIYRSLSEQRYFAGGAGGRTDMPEITTVYTRQ